jgi:hypothetical protein
MTFKLINTLVIILLLGHLQRFMQISTRTKASQLSLLVIKSKYKYMTISTILEWNAINVSVVYIRIIKLHLQFFFLHSNTLIIF